jgi:hypothetical protein
LIDEIYSALYFLPNHLINIQDHQNSDLGRPQTLIEPDLNIQAYSSTSSESHEYPVLCQVGCIRECIAWVTNELKSGAGLMLSSKRLRHEFMDPREAEMAAIFCYLWVQWLEQNGASGNTIFWTSGCNGISDVETLKIVSILILYHSSDSSGKTRWLFGAARRRSWVDKDFAFLERVIEGASRLSNKPDNIIASEFIQALKNNIELRFLSKMKSCLPPAVSRVFADKVLETDSKTIIERSASIPYNMTLTAHDPPEDFQLKKRQTAAEIARLQVSKSTSMLAGSLSSAFDLSSMRRMARQKGSALTSISWKTLSFQDQISERLSLLDLTESARDTDSGQSIAAEHRPIAGSFSSALFGASRKSNGHSKNENPDA